MSGFTKLKKLEYVRHLLEQVEEYYPSDHEVARELYEALEELEELIDDEKWSNINEQEKVS